MGYSVTISDCYMEVSSEKSNETIDKILEKYIIL